MRLNGLADHVHALFRSVAGARIDVPLNLATNRLSIAEDLRKGRKPRVVLEYPDTSEVLRNAAAAATDLEFGSTWIDDLLRKKVERLLDDLAENGRHSPDYVAASSVSEFGQLASGLVQDALEILSRPDEPDLPVGEEVQSASSAATFIKAELTRRSILGWEVVVESDMQARMSVSGPQRRIRVREGATFSLSQLRRLAIHEVGTHVVRYERGARQPLPLLRIPLTSYIKTEEGLAVFNEQQSGVLSQSDLRKYAARVLAAQLAQTNDATGVYEALREFTDHDLAVEIVLRSKRGMTTLSSPGAHLKDTVYLAGLREIEDLEAQDSHDVELLMSCKQSASILPDLRALEADGLLKAIP